MTPEQQARAKIDVLLRDAGWAVQNRTELDLTAERCIADHELVSKPGNSPAEMLRSEGTNRNDEEEGCGAEVERRLSVVDKLEATITANLRRATRLRQSVLSRAMRGGSESTC